jgi:hypothetical protein
MRSLRITAFKEICGIAFDYNDSRCFTEFKMLFVQATQWLATSLSHNDLRWSTNLGDLGSLSFSVPEPPDFLSKIKALRQELNLEKQIILGYLRKQSGKNKLEGPKMILMEILCEYHGVNNDIDNNEPLVIRELARGEVNGFEDINMSPSKISNYFKLIFPDQKVPGTVSGYALYEELCKKKLIVNYLRKLQNPADSYKKLRDQKKNDWIMKQRSTMDNLPDLD